MIWIGTIPTQIGLLSQLTVLDLAVNCLMGYYTNIIQ